MSRGTETTAPPVLADRGPVVLPGRGFGWFDWGRLGLAAAVCLTLRLVRSDPRSAGEDGANHDDAMATVIPTVALLVLIVVLIGALV